MVRLINDSNLKFLTSAVYRILRFQEIFTHIENHNHPKNPPCIFALWHANQLLVHGIKDRKNLSVLISNSIDGQIVASVCENWGFKVVRGSSGKKGSVESTMQMLERLKNGESVAIMVDGPHGPLHKVKNGAIKLAQLSGATNEELSEIKEKIKNELLNLDAKAPEIYNEAKKQGLWDKKKKN